MLIDPRTGRAKALAAAADDDEPYPWFTHGGAATAGHLVVATQEGYLFAYRLDPNVSSRDPASGPVRSRRPVR